MSKIYNINIKSGTTKYIIYSDLNINILNKIIKLYNAFTNDFMRGANDRGANDMRSVPIYFASASFDNLRKLDTKLIYYELNTEKDELNTPSGVWFLQELINDIHLNAFYKPTEEQFKRMNELYKVLDNKFDVD